MLCSRSAALLLSMPHKSFWVSSLNNWEIWVLKHSVSHLSSSLLLSGGIGVINSVVPVMVKIQTVLHSNGLLIFHVTFLQIRPGTQPGQMQVMKGKGDDDHTPIQFSWTRIWIWSYALSWKLESFSSCVSFVSEFLCESVKGLRVRFCQELTVITMLQVLKC